MASITENTRPKRPSARKATVVKKSVFFMVY